MDDLSQDVQGTPSSAPVGDPPHSGTAPDQGAAVGSPPRSPSPQQDSEGVRRRIDQLTARHRASEARNTDLQRQLDELRASDRKRMDQVASAFGINQPDPQQAELRNELLGVLGLKPDVLDLLSDGDRLKKLLDLEQRWPEVEEFRNHYFSSMGSDQLREVDREIAEEYGVEGLDPDKSQIAAQLYVAWIEPRPDRVQRYNQRDPKLVKEYRAWYRTHFADPFRRSSAVEQTARAAAARRLPPGGDGGVIGRTAAEPPAGDIEARAKLAFQRLAESKV